MVYDTLERPPRPGSLTEYLCVMVQMRRDTTRLMETRVMVQAVRDDSEDGEHTQKAFEDFRNALMPYLAQEARDSQARVRAAMDNEAKMGPMSIRPLVKPSPGVSSRLRRIVKDLEDGDGTDMHLTKKRGSLDGDMS